jgi:hypothetical protein
VLRAPDQGLDSNLSKQEEPVAQSATRELQPEALAAFMALLQDVLDQHGTITLRAVKRFRSENGMPATRKAEVVFGTRRVNVLRGLSPEVFMHAVTHELTHLQRGPALLDEIEAEEVLVEDLAQTLLYGSPRPVSVAANGKPRRHLQVVR